MKQRYIVHTEQIRDNAIKAIRALSIPPESKPLVVEIKPLTRTLDQNAKFHAICSDIARQAEYIGRRLDASQWKVLLVSGHAVVTKIGADMVPGLEGEYVNLRESTAQMPVARMASLIEYATAYAVDNGVRLGQ